MNNIERRRIGSIPPGIREGSRKDVLRLPITIQLGGGGLGGLRRARQGENLGNVEQDWGKVVDKQAFTKPAREKPAARAKLSEIEEKIGWETEVIDNYNAQGDLGILLQFNGINLAQAFFMRGRRYYGLDTTLFYSPTIYNKRRALLLLFTCGDIFEAQVVPERKDLNPFFQEEIYLPPLAQTHDPRSMTVNQNNKLVIVSYKLR